VSDEAGPDSAVSAHGDVRDRATWLDAMVDRMTSQLAGLAGDRAGAVDLSDRWLQVAASLDGDSPILAQQARQVSISLAELDGALALLSGPVGTFIGAVGRAADSLRATAD
jgi:hypothetical protein